jgi:hypothetical protein
MLPASLPLRLAGLWWRFFGHERGSGIRGDCAALGWKFGESTSRVRSRQRRGHALSSASRSNF